MSVTYQIISNELITCKLITQCFICTILDNYNNSSVYTPPTPINANISGYNYAVVTNNNYIKFSNNYTIDSIVIGGGGGGGYDHGGGGGAGGLAYNTEYSIDNTSLYNIYIGIGGGKNLSGNNSTAFSLTGNGGGYGGSFPSALPSIGGSGGGGGGYFSGQEGAASNQTDGLGNKGGNGYPNVISGGGGGGGAGLEGGNAGPREGDNSFGGVGGNGTINYSTWLTAVSNIMPNEWVSATNSGYIAGGGSGGSWAVARSDGGLGGGGTGGTNNGSLGNIPATSGIKNTGGGGGGGSSGNGQGASGGDGIVIVRWSVTENEIIYPLIGAIINNVLISNQSIEIIGYNFQYITFVYLNNISYNFNIINSNSINVLFTPVIQVEKISIKDTNNNIVYYSINTSPILTSANSNILNTISILGTNLSNVITVLINESTIFSFTQTDSLISVPVTSVYLVTSITVTDSYNNYFSLTPPPSFYTNVLPIFDYISYNEDNTNIQFPFFYTINGNNFLDVQSIYLNNTQYSFVIQNSNTIQINVLNLLEVETIKIINNYNEEVIETITPVSIISNITNEYNNLYIEATNLSTITNIQLNNISYTFSIVNNRIVVPYATVFSLLEITINNTENNYIYTFNSPLLTTIYPIINTVYSPSQGQLVIEGEGFYYAEIVKINDKYTYINTNINNINNIFLYNANPYNFTVNNEGTTITLSNISFYIVNNLIVIDNIDGEIETSLFYIAPQPFPTCFPKNTPILVDQGIIPIQKLKPIINTIEGKPIIAISQTISPDNYLICIEKNALDINYPNEKTILSKYHKVLFEEKMVYAYKLIHLIKNNKNNKNNNKMIYKIDYAGDVLYNVLLEEYSTMKVNNLLVETLDPNNIIGQLYNKNTSFDKKLDLIKEIKDYGKKRNWDIKRK